MISIALVVLGFTLSVAISFLGVGSVRERTLVGLMVALFLLPWSAQGAMPSLSFELIARGITLGLTLSIVLGMVDLVAAWVASSFGFSARTDVPERWIGLLLLLAYLNAGGAALMVELIWLSLHGSDMGFAATLAGVFAGAVAVALPWLILRSVAALVVGYAEGENLRVRALSTVGAIAVVGATLLPLVSNSSRWLLEATLMLH